MAFKITYKRLFEIKFQHDFYLNKGSNEFDSLTEDEQTALLASNLIMKDLEIWPTEATQRIMQGLKLILKPTTTGFFVAGEVEDNGFGGSAPKIEFGKSLRLSFAFKFKNPYFLNFTNLSQQITQNLIYLDNRLTPQGADPDIAAYADFKGPSPFLSLKPLTKSNSQTYMPGDMVSRSQADLEGNDTYAVDLLVDGNQDFPNEPKTPIWKPLNGTGYVNGRDLVKAYRKTFRYTFKQGAVSEANFTLLHWDGKIDDIGSFSLETGQSTSSHQIDASIYPSGKYVLKVEGKGADGQAFDESNCIYLDDALITQGAQGVIEMFHEGQETEHAYSLQKTETKSVEGEDKEVHTLLNPIFHIHFKNRESFWRYIFNQELEEGINLGELVKENEEEDIYVSQTAKPLTLQFSQVEFNGGFLLPNPGVEQVKIEQEKFFSDLYIYT